MVLDGWKHLPVGDLGMGMCMCNSEVVGCWEHLPVEVLGVVMCMCNSDGARWVETPSRGRSWRGDVYGQL